MNNKTIAAVLTALVLAYGGYEWYGGEEPIYPGAPGDSWCDNDYDKRIDINVNNTAGSALSDYQVYVNLSSNPINETSLRVYNSTSCTLRPHWTENETGGNSYGVWINYSYIAASTWTNNTAIYYDNAVVSSTTNGDNTFVFFDDFERSNIGGNITNPWTRYASNPVFVKNATNSWDSYFVNDPEICKHLNGTAYQDASNNYFMYYSGSGHNDGVNNDQIGLALSTDLNNWTRLDNGDGGRVLKFGSGTFEDGQWDDADVQLGTVLYDNGIFHMWYNGNSNPANDFCRLGYANSTDGKNWTKYASNPILSQGPDGDADDLYVPTVIYDNITWKMWYAGQKTGGGRIAVMYATAPNPHGPWTKHSNAHIYDQGYDMFPTSIWNESGTYHMIFFPLTVTDLRHATSSDGITWTYDGIIFERGNSGEWDDHHIQEVSQFLVGSTWYTFYTGGGAAGVFSNGYATSTVRVPTPAVEKWYQKDGTVSLDDGYCKLNTSETECIQGKTEYATGYSMRWRADAKDDGGSQDQRCMGWVDDYSGWICYAYMGPWHIDEDADRTKDGATFELATHTGGFSTGFRVYEISRPSATSVKYYDDDVLTSECTDTNDIPDGDLAPMFYVYSDDTDQLWIDWVLVRKYTSPEPSTTLGSEEDQPATTPVVSNITNGSISATSQWIKWEINQTAHNRVLYSNQSDLTPAWYSTWDNSTAAPNITLSGLDASTQYWYQVWSYNTTNTSLSDNSSTLSFTTAAAANYITITGGNRALFCNWSSNTTLSSIAANLTNCTDFFAYNSTSQRWTFYNVNRTINANTVIHKHAAIFVCFNNTTTVECDILAAETITIPSNVWYYTALRESTSKTLTEINTAITADGCTISDLYAWNSTVGSYTNTGSYSVLPNEGFAIYATTGCPWDGSI